MSTRKASTLCPRCQTKIQFAQDPRQAFCPRCVDYLDNIERELADDKALERWQLGLDDKIPGAWPARKEGG